MNFLMVALFGLLGRKRGSAYSFLFMHPDGKQLAELGELLKSERIWHVTLAKTPLRSLRPL